MSVTSRDVKIRKPAGCLIWVVTHDAGKNLDEKSASVNDGSMKEMRHAGGTVVLDDDVADALEKLAEALSKAGMAAKVNIQPDSTAKAINIEVGHDAASGHDHVLHAKPARSEGSHLGHEEL